MERLIRIINFMFDKIISDKYEGHLKSSWTGVSEPLLCRGRWWLLCQVIVVGGNVVVAWSSSL
jgi:hypothetical protein